MRTTFALLLFVLHASSSLAQDAAVPVDDTTNEEPPTEELAEQEVSYSTPDGESAIVSDDGEDEQVEEAVQAEETASEQGDWDMQSGFGSHDWLIDRARRQRGSQTSPEQPQQPADEPQVEAEPERPSVIISGRFALGAVYELLPGFNATFGVAVGVGLFEAIDLEIHGALSTTSEEVQNDRGARFSYIDFGLRVCRRILYGWIEPAVCLGAGMAQVSVSSITVGEIESSRSIFVGQALARIGLRPSERVSIELDVGAGLGTPSDTYLLRDPMTATEQAIHSPSDIFPSFSLGARVEFN